MEPVGSSPCLQEPSTGLYPEPDQSNPNYPTQLQSVLRLVRKRLSVRHIHI
jgi:hypothetical protein